MIFISGTGRVPGAAAESAPVGAEPFAARNYVWQSPPAPAKPAQAQPPQQQQQHPATPPPAPARPMPMAMPMPMPVAPAPMLPRPMAGPVITHPVALPPVMTPVIPRMPVSPAVRMPAIPRAIPIPTPSPNVRPMVIPPAQHQPRFLPIVPLERRRIGQLAAPQPVFGKQFIGPVPIPPKFGHIVLEPGIGGGSQAFLGASSSQTAMPVPPLFCGPGFFGCGFGFDGDFDDFAFFGQPFFFFSFGGPFGLGTPCLFQGFTLNCFGPAWNGPFGWDWATPWGYNPALTGTLYPIGGYVSPTPMEMNAQSVESPGPSAFLPPPPQPLILASVEGQAQPVAYLMTKDGIEFGVTKYWVEDNRICYVTTYNVQSCISLDQLDLQATVDINYKRGITFTLTPKPEEQQPNPPQPPDSQPQVQQQL